MTTLLELAAKVEGASGPDREIDAVIHALIVLAEFGTPEVDIERCLTVVREPWDWEDEPHPILEYTASLDAAMSLVPEGWRWLVRSSAPNSPDAGKYFARIETPDFNAYSWGKGEDWIREIESGAEFKALAATPALALCSAALKALAAGETQP